VHVPNRLSIERRAAKISVDPVYNNAPSEKMSQTDNVTLDAREVTLAPSLTVPSSIRPTFDRHQSSPTLYKPSGAPSSSYATDASQNGSSLAKDIPFKEECMRIVATFLKPGSPRELNLDAAIRDATMTELAHSTHPDVVSIPVICYS